MACEDAPCCGCCGPLLDAADDLAAMERAYDGDDFDFYEPDAWDDEDEDEETGDEDAGMESALMGGGMGGDL
jgi:hypothetical protein